MQSGLSRDVHDDIAEEEELLGCQVFCKEVGEIFVRGDVRYRDAELLDGLANEEVATLDMLGALVVLRVVGQVACGAVVEGERSRAAVFDTELIEEAARVDDVLRGDGGGDDLGLAAGERDGFLLLRAVEDGGVREEDASPPGRRVTGSPVGVGIGVWRRELMAV